MLVGRGEGCPCDVCGLVMDRGWVLVGRGEGCPCHVCGLVMDRVKPIKTYLIDNKSHEQKTVKINILKENEKQSLDSFLETNYNGDHMLK